MPTLWGSGSMRRFLGECVIFQNDDALEEIRKRPGCSQSCHPGSDNDGLFPDERGQRNLFQIFLERQSELKLSNHTSAKKECDIAQGDSGRVGNTDTWPETSFWDIGPALSPSGD